MVKPERKTLGRQRVAMVRMQKESNRLVTFSKRRSGLFKKASELCTLCRAEAAIIVFSPGRKAFSFGHPSVDTVVNRFLGVNPEFNRGGNHALEAHEYDNVSRFNMELTLINTRIEGEKKHSEDLIKMRKSKGEQFSWLSSIENLGLERLKQLQKPISELRNNVFLFGNKVSVDATSTNPPFAGMNPTGSGYQIPPNDNAMGGQNPFGGQSSLLMVPNPMGRGPNDHPPMVMIPTPTACFGDPSDGTGMSSTDPPSFMQNPMEGFNVPNVQPFQEVGNNLIQGFDALNVQHFQGLGNNPIQGIEAPNVQPFQGLGNNSIQGFDAPHVLSFQGVPNNPLGGQPDGPTLPFNMGMNPPMSGNPGRFTSLLMGPDPMGDLNAPFNPQGGFGFRPRFF